MLHKIGDHVAFRADRNKVLQNFSWTIVGRIVAACDLPEGDHLIVSDDDTKDDPLLFVRYDYELMRVHT